jgi:hypothetical protein
VVLSESYSIPDRFVNELSQYDPLLRIRWGRKEGIVRVERKVARGYSLDSTSVADFDDALMIRDGYALVFKFPPLEHNYSLMLYTLWHGDLRRLGGAKILADDIEAREIYEKSRRAWNRRDDFRCLAGDLFRVMNTARTSPEGAGWRKNKSFKD